MTTAPAAYGVVLLDREPTDTTVFPLDSLTSCPRELIPMSDRDGNAYMGRLVYYSDRLFPVNDFIQTALTSGELPDREPIPYNSLVRIELARRPRAGKPIHFCR